MVIKRSNFIPRLFGASVFSPFPAFSAKQITRRMPDEWNEMFDDAPVILPIPDGAPKELPLVILRSAAKGYSCTFTSDRIQFQWAYNPNKPDVEAPVDFYAFAANFFIAVKRVFEPKFGRISAVCHRIAPHQNPALFLASHFCKDQWLSSPFNRPETFEINSHKRYGYKDYNVNSWVRNKSSKNSVSPPHSGVLVEQDLNTLQEEINEANFSENQIIAFYNDIQVELDAIMDHYYP